MPRVFSPRLTLLAGLGLVAATFAAYLPAWEGQFLWDDDSWTTLIADLLRDRHGLWRMWTQPGALQQYYPLSGTTFWLDHRFWGGWTLPYHLENIALHAIAALLFWRLLGRLTVPGAALAAAIFALHPVMVESVAWITERKNVLSLACYLAALLCYGRFTGFWAVAETGAPTLSAGRRAGWYAVGLGIFLLALTAKVTAFSLPAVVLLLCWWRRGRIRWREDTLPTLPFFALSVGFGLLIHALETGVGARGPDFAFTLAQRCLLAGRVLWFYPATLLWPAHQSFIYPRWELDPRSPAQWLYPVTALTVLLGSWFARKRLGRGLATAIFFYAGTLFPVVGFLNGYFMVYSFVWDHLVYLSSLGIITLAAAGIVRAAERLHRPWVITAFAALVLPVLAALTWRQSTMYQDVFTLYRTTIRQNPACWLAYGNLGSALVGRGQVDEGIAMYERAIALRPAYPEAHNNLANALARSGRAEEAVAHYEAALAIFPDLTGAHANAAAVLASLGRLDEAIVHYRQATNTAADRVAALVDLGRALAQNGEDREAYEQFKQALSLRPGDYGVASHLAFLLASTADPNLRDGGKALALARRINAATHDAEPTVLRTLAAAQAAAGQFPAAVATAHRALEIATTRHDEALVAALQDDLSHYESDTALTRASPLK